jgi:WD40 repeat protein
VNSVAFSSDGLQVVSGSNDNTIRIWNVERGKEEQKLKGHSSQVNSVAFSPDGLQVVSGSNDKTIRIWNVKRGDEEQKLEGHLSSVSSVAFSPNGLQVVSGSRDNNIRIWNVERGEEEDKLLGNSSSVASLAFSSDGQNVPISHYLNGQWIDHPYFGEYKRIYLPFFNLTCSTVYQENLSLCLGFYSGKVVVIKPLKV